MRSSRFLIVALVAIMVACAKEDRPTPPNLGPGQTFNPNVVTGAQAIQYGSGPYYCGSSRYGCPQWQYAVCLESYCVYTTCVADGGLACPSDRATCDTSVNYCKNVTNNTIVPPSPDAGPSRACRNVSDCSSGEFCRVTTSGCTTATGTCVVSRDLICRDDYLTYCSCSGSTVNSWYSTDCAPEQYQYLGACQSADGGTLDGGISVVDGGTLADAGIRLDGGVSIPDAGVAPADGGVSQPDAGVSTPADGGVAPLADGGTSAPPTIPQGANGVVRIVIDAARVGCSNAHIAAFGNVSNFSIPLENGTLSLDVNIFYSGTMDTTIHCGSHAGSTFAPDYSQYGANNQTAAQVGYREVAYYSSSGSRIDLLNMAITCNNKLRVPLGNSTASCP